VTPFRSSRTKGGTIVYRRGAFNIAKDGGKEGEKTNPLPPEVGGKRASFIWGRFFTSLYMPNGGEGREGLSLSSTK